jgi:hypothetical protein
VPEPKLRAGVAVRLAHRLRAPAFAGATLVKQFVAKKQAGQYLSSGLIFICKELEATE